MKAYKKNMAFTSAAESAAKRIKDQFNLTDVLDAGRLSIAYALREGIPVERAPGFGPMSGSNYNVGSVDPDGELRDLLLALRPGLNEDPYRVLETLMNDGALKLDAEVSSASILSLRDLLN
ncbi:hypothetical protein [Actinoplanes sp. OR16]|uniref:hypothetical protein n=1 Tax=Actinoplanes sp. OR16 TaxID=946334 RepID=UPI000FD77BB8|nr:hypothetical protein [Actinoplanes sp. OR16]